MPASYAGLLLLLTAAVQAGPGQQQKNKPENKPRQDSGNDGPTFSIPQTPPEDAVTVPGDFIGFGFETAFLPHFDNESSANIVNSVGSRLSEPIAIRIGGTSGDRVRFNESQEQAAYCWKGPHCPNSHLNSFILGPSYFEGFKRFPNAKFSFQAPMDNGMNIKKTMAYVRNAWNAIGQDRVDAIALGNEPGYYKNWTAQKYVNMALAIEGNVTNKLDLSGDDARIFQFGEIASKPAKDSKPYGLKATFDQGINENGQGKYAAEHYYQNLGDQEFDYSAKNVQERLMNHSLIVNTLKPYKNHAEQVHNSDADNPPAYILSEVAAAISKSPIRFSGGFGAAMWAVDFHLATMARGIQRVTNTMRPVAVHSFWVPDDSAPKTGRPVVQGVFPSAPFIADFIGTDKNTGTMAELDPNEGKGQLDHITVYARYGADDQLVRMAVVNLKQWHSNSTAERGETQVTLDVGTGVKSASVRRMHSATGSSARGYDLSQGTENVTWAGEQWTYEIDQGQGHFPQGPAEKDNETLEVEDGQVTVSVPDTEAVIVDLKQRGGESDGSDSFARVLNGFHLACLFVSVHVIAYFVV